MFVLNPDFSKEPSIIRPIKSASVTYSSLEARELRSRQEAQHSVVDLKEDDPNIVHGMIHYFYNVDYDYHIKDLTQVRLSGTIYNLRMYAIADKYMVLPLKQLALKRFELRCTYGWTLGQFVEAIEEVYSTPMVHERNREQVIVNCVKSHMSIMQHPETSPEHKEFHSLLRETELGADVAIALAKLRERQHCNACIAYFERFGIPATTSRRNFYCSDCI